MKVSDTGLDKVLLFEPKVYGDARGFFYETFNQKRYADFISPHEFVQDNLSYSARGVLRGLHYQHPQAQGKLVMVLQGAVFDVAVDIRVGSPNFGQWTGVELTAGNRRQLWIPPGFAHGFCVTSDEALFLYKCSDYYNPADEGTIIWNDPAIGIDWPLAEVELSEKDTRGTRLDQVPIERLPTYSDLRPEGERCDHA